MLRNRLFSLNFATCLIFITALIVGCSLDSQNPLSTDTTTPSISAKRAKRDKAVDTGSSTSDGTDSNAADASTPTGYTFAPVQFEHPIAEDSRIVTGRITVKDGGVLKIENTKKMIKIVFPPNSVPYNTRMKLELLHGKNIDFRVLPHMVLNEPATLVVRGRILVPEGGSDLYHHALDGPEWTSDGPVSEETYTEAGEVLYQLTHRIRLPLDHFSRYAFGSRF